MSSRDEVYSVLTADAEFTILVPAVYERSAVVDSPDPPFAVLAWGGRTPGISRMKQRILTLFVHDHRGSYDHIEAALARAEALLLAATWSLGITSIEWLGNSDDLFDPDRGTNLQYATYRVTGAGL